VGQVCSGSLPVWLCSFTSLPQRLRLCFCEPRRTLPAELAVQVISPFYAFARMDAGFSCVLQLDSGQANVQRLHPSEGQQGSCLAAALCGQSTWPSPGLCSHSSSLQHALFRSFSIHGFISFFLAVSSGTLCCGEASEYLNTLLMPLFL
jgi:hypothetical protein